MGRRRREEFWPGGAVAPSLLLFALLSLSLACAPLTWQLPTGWSAEQATLRDPDGVVRLAIVEAPDPQRAWNVVHPEATPLVADGAPVRWPPSRGWELQRTWTFTAARLEERSFGGRTWFVVIEGDASALARRDAQIDEVLASLTPRGMHAESFAGRAARDIDLAALDAFVGEAMQRLGVPGTAVAITRGGKVIYERALGVKTLGAPDPITPDTLFLMASVTKPMTTMMEARLIDAGLFTWDTKVKTLLPDFALGDATLTDALRLWHMSCACTGMPRRDLDNLFEFANVTPEARLASMRVMQPTTGLGETFQYSNLMVAAGGFAAAHAMAPDKSLTEAYAAAMQAKIFGPLRMSSSTADFAAALGRSPASPHALDIDGVVRPLALGFEGNVVPIAPAGAVWSTLHDMEQYALAELREAGSKRWRRRIGTEEAGYGLGIDLEEQLGLQIVGHDGGSGGFGTSLWLLPEHDLALLILTNVRNGTGAEQLPFNAAVKRKVLELLFSGAAPVSPVIVEFALTMRAQTVRQQAADVDRRVDPQWLVGTWTDPELGEVVIRPGVFDVGEWQVRFGRRGDSLVVLDPPFAGSVMAATDAAITIPYPQKAYVLRKTGAAAR